MSNLIILSSANVPCTDHPRCCWARSAHSLSHLLSSVLSQCSLVLDLSVMLPPSPVGWAKHDCPSVGRKGVEGKDQTCLQTWHGGNRNIAPALICCYCKENHFCRSCSQCQSWSVAVLPSPGLTPGCGHRDERCKTSCHVPSPCVSQSIGALSPVPRAGREERRQRCEESERQLTTASDKSKIFHLSLFWCHWSKPEMQWFPVQKFMGIISVCW